MRELTAILLVACMAFGFLLGFLCARQLERDRRYMRQLKREQQRERRAIQKIFEDSNKL
jgi:heme exporter protein D